MTEATKEDPKKLIDAFMKVLRLAGIRPASIKLARECLSLEVEVLPAPHKPTKLRDGRMAVYVFYDASAFKYLSNSNCLKVGKVGLRSKARYENQHYNPGSSKSNLAKSLLNDDDFKRDHRRIIKIGSWIKNNTGRINFLLDAEAMLATETSPMHVITLLEAFLQCYLQPKYEGH